MPRFAEMLAQGMKARGHAVELWTPQAFFSRMPGSGSVRKWMGYVDQYVLFPIRVRQHIRHITENTLFVFADHALGPWVPLIKDRPHVIHCHDFMAQRSALKEIPENPTGWTGRKYQGYIRKGYSRGKNFISVSQKTRDDLHDFLKFIPRCSKVVYNGFNRVFKPMNVFEARKCLKDKTGLDLEDGFLMHIGGNKWYKNRLGVIEMYQAWRSISREKLPLLMIGETPDAGLWSAFQASSFKTDIHFLSGTNDETVAMAYCGASVLLFPSLAEGFGWPIAEAMACGCPVITTNEAPMTEVANGAAFLIPRRPLDKEKAALWAWEAARMIEVVIELPEDKRQKVIAAGLMNAKRFDTALALDSIEAIYQNALQCDTGMPAFTQDRDKIPANPW